MSDSLDELIARARSGIYEDFNSLVEALRTKALANFEILVEMARSNEEVARRAAISVASAHCFTQPAVLDAMRALARDPVMGVRQALAYALTDFPIWPLDDVVETLLADDMPDVRQAAAYASKPRPGTHAAILTRFKGEPTGWVRSAIAFSLGEANASRALPALLTALAEDIDADVQRNCALSIDLQLTRLNGNTASIAIPSADALAAARQRLRGLTGLATPSLTPWLDKQLVTHVDIQDLAAFGSVLTEEAKAGKLPHAHHVDVIVQAVLRSLHGAPPRAAVLIGESGAGKTAIANEVTHRLLRDPGGAWHVLRMSPADFMAGTKFLGEWETRVQNVIQAIKQPRRVVLYVPNVEELSWMGTWNKSEASVASALAPAIERGEIVILGETTPDGFRKGLGGKPHLRRLFHPIEVMPADPATTHAILQEVVRETGARIEDGLLDRLNDLAEYFSASAQQPGRTVGLLRRVLGSKAGAEPVTERDVLATISTSTGIPVPFLDDNQPLDRAAVRAFFESRVMGQPEAVDSIIDLVTLVKAGLTDPGKPFGVLLFVGPTGVGKTELARALAEHLFGDVSRLLRLDMSEFATYEAFERLIGSSFRPSEPGILTSAVRERPFSVLLLDEIEKAHPNIYNLCLQIFDAGRLTDTQGQPADFRRTIIILTSNVGSTVSTEGSVGFGRKPGASAPSRENTLRELGRWFRPEFLNRLDRIVTFRPLAVETAEKIAQRELGRVLERAGITRRQLAVDIDPDVLPLLLREGYSPAFGARPLKRTIERLVLLPLARVIADGKTPKGSLLRLIARQQRIAVEIEPPDKPDEPAQAAPAPRAHPVSQRLEQMLSQLAEIMTQSAPLATRKSDLLAESLRPGFWDDARASRGCMDEIYRLDSILNGLGDLERKLRGEHELAQRQRHSERDLARIDERVDGLESQLRHLAFLAACRDETALGDALVILRRSTRQGKPLDAVPTLARMYQKLAERRGLEVQVLDDRCEKAADTITLLVYGAGAFALLAPEAGMHQFSHGKSGIVRDRKSTGDREVVHVDVLPAPRVEAEFGDEEAQVEIRPLGGTRGRMLAKLNYEVRIFHRPSMLSVRGWCDGNKSDAAQRMKQILRARLDAAQIETQKPSVVRRYRLGPTTLVRDQRTGKSTGRLDQVLDGHLDMFLVGLQRGVPSTA
jgi:ATP-dependent Clp protease ATP-binding subunit ClpC